MKINAQKSIRILRLKTVLESTGLSRSTVYLRIAEGNFPKQVSLGARAVGWIEAEVEAWLIGQVESSRAAHGESSREGGQG